MPDDTEKYWDCSPNGFDAENAADVDMSLREWIDGDVEEV